MKAAYITKSAEETIILGERLAYRLSGGDVVLLFGDLGSGKTHFVKGIAKGLGIDEVVKSPTFAYVNRYPIGGQPFGRGSALRAGVSPSGEETKTLFHYDLYRLNVGDDVSSIGLSETLEDEHTINVVEWADRLGENLPERFVRVELQTVAGSGQSHGTSSGSHETSDYHKIEIEFVDPDVVPEDRIEEFYEEWGTPIHVRDHIKQVTNVAMQIGKAYVEAGEIVDLNLLYTASMLHDIARVCDFRELDKSQFKEEITDDKWEKWVDLRKTHKGFHHADIAAKFFRKFGYHKTADLIYAHKSLVIVEEPDLIDILEKKIIYYADKRVKHDQVVNLKERFRDGWERYGKYDDTQTRQLFDEVERKTFELEQVLFDQLDISPGDID